MYHSIHAYQSTESIENHWKDFRFQSENGIKYTYHQAVINTFFKKQPLDMLNLKGKNNNVSVNVSHMRERAREKERERERKKEGQINKDPWRERVQGDS